MFVTQDGQHQDGPRQGGVPRAQRRVRALPERRWPRRYDGLHCVDIDLLLSLAYALK